MANDERTRYLHQLETWRDLIAGLSMPSKTALFHAIGEMLNDTGFLRDPIERRLARYARDLERRGGTP